MEVTQSEKTSQAESAEVAGGSGEVKKFFSLASFFCGIKKVGKNIEL
jgi:hypothetical protein